jgi:multifunctional beta-oxidation protein
MKEKKHDAYVNDKTLITDTLAQQPGKAPSNEHLDAIATALTKEGAPTEYKYDERDVILYNLGLGAKRTELKYVFEGAEDFQVLPTFGVIPPFNAEMPFDYDAIVPNFSPMMLLHGEQFLEIRKWPLPTAAKLVSRAKLLEVVDKGSAAMVKVGSTTRTEAGEDVFYNEMTVVLRGCGGFGGPRKGEDRGASTAANKPPSRHPDAIVEEATSEDQAAIYRLSGDYKYVLPLGYDLIEQKCH